MMMRGSARIISLTILIALLACSGGGGSEQDDSSSGDDLSADSRGLSTQCGVRVDGILRDPVSPERGEQVELVSVVDSNAVIVTSGTAQRLVKLQGIGGTTGFTNTAAAALFAELAVEPLYFFAAGQCTAAAAGQPAAVGQIVTASGRSFTEELIAHKYAGVIETAGTCGEEALSSCYAGIADSNEHHNYGPLKECEPQVPPSVQYRPADEDCGGNASLIMTEEFYDAFSPQLRYPDGTDRIIEDCEDTECTPLKAQDYIRTEHAFIACFGAPGNAVALDDVNHVSIKMAPDDHDPPRFCIPDPALPIN